MASHAMHVECYNATHQHKAKGRPAMYFSKCAAGPNCRMGGTLHKGQLYTWERGDGKGFAASVNVPSKAEPTAPPASAAEIPEPPALPEEEEEKPEEKESTAGQATGSTANEASALCDQLIAKLPRQHKMFKLLLQCVAARVNPWIAGPAASGKTTAAQNVAKALGLKFAEIGKLGMGDEIRLLGAIYANGNYVRTPFRDIFEHGGVFLLDEWDGSDASISLVLNAALANGCMSFPDGMVERHPDCIIIVCANTFGNGATQEYVGRMRQDAAFLSRFAFIGWDYDADLEMATGPNPEWTKRVQALRARVAERGLRVLVTPRATYHGARLLAAGIPQDVVEQMTIKQGMTNEQWAQIANR